MKLTQFKRIMKDRGYNIGVYYGNGYTISKDSQQYFISRYDVICLSDISYFNIEDFKFK